MNREEILTRLKASEPFGDIPDHVLDWVIDRSEIRFLAENDVLVNIGDEMTHMIVVLKGQMMWEMTRHNQTKEQGLIPEGRVTGMLPFSRAKFAQGKNFAFGKEGAVLLAFHKEHFAELQCVSYELIQNLVAVMTNRVRELTRIQQQNEKLISLGKLSAGLSHELNNPAAAVVRSAQELKKHLGTVPDKFKRVMLIRLEEETVDRINNFVFSNLDSSAAGRLTLTERTDREDAIADFLAENGVEDEYEPAHILTEFGFTPENIYDFREQVKDEFVPVMDWIVNVLTTEKFVNEIMEASRRISGIVKAVKTFSHMDRDQGSDSADLTEGLNSTLMVLTHKIKNKKIQIISDFDPTVPKIKVNVGEINQVWLNLTDNAIDALPEGGTLKITTENKGEFVWITFTDNGSGIAPEVLPFIFDPFFTTKPVGQGTGLGLDVVRKIVEGHRGSIKAESQPGKTVFRVCLPNR